MLQRRVWKLEAMRKQCGCVRSLQKFGVLQAAFMGSKVSRTVKICVSKLFQMAESPKAVVVESENAATPQEEARGSVPEVETIPEVPPARVGGSPAPSLSPMTPEEKGEERLEGDVVVKESTKKKPRLHYEVSGLSGRVEKACETMNGLSSAMTKMCEAFQTECSELHQGLKAMWLQGISNKGMLAAMVTYENTLRDISWQVSGSGKAQSNTSLKAATIAWGDKVTSVHQALKEMNRLATEHNKGLMEQLSSLELAIKSLNLPVGPAAIPPGGFDAMPAFMPPATPAADPGPMASRPEMPSFTAVPMPQRQPDIASVFTTPVGRPEIPVGSSAVPAAFQSAKATSAPGQGSSATYARRAYRVVVQTGQGSSKVRAISPSAIRAVETPPPGWHQAYGLGDVVISGWRHRVLPDSFISDAVQYPEL